MTDQQRATRRRLTRARAESFARGNGIAPASEGQRLDRDRRHPGFDHLNGEVVLVARLVRALAAGLVDADDVVDAAAVSGYADHGRNGAARLLRNQDVRQHADTGPGVEDDLLAPVAGKRARVERDRAKRPALGRESADEVGQLRAQRLLPLLRLPAAAGLEAQAARRLGVEIECVGHGIESTVVEALVDAGERADVGR